MTRPSKTTFPCGNRNGGNDDPVETLGRASAMLLEVEWLLSATRAPHTTAAVQVIGLCRFALQHPVFASAATEPIERTPRLTAALLKAARSIADALDKTPPPRDLAARTELLQPLTECSADDVERRPLRVQFELPTELRGPF